MAQKALIDPAFEGFVSQIIETNKKAAENRAQGKEIPWFRPSISDSDWDGDLQTKESLKKLQKAFDLPDAEEALRDTMKKSSPGNASDIIALTLQLDYMAQAERAYRARVSMPFNRQLSHLIAREKSHGTDDGVLNKSTIAYINGIIKQGSEGEGGAA